jgi:hypothetical protein
MKFNSNKNLASFSLFLGGNLATKKLKKKLLAKREEKKKKNTA